MNIEAKNAAFPHPHCKEYGISKLEYFAAEAMKVLLEHDLNRRVDNQKGLEWVKEKSYSMAELMLSE